MKWATLILGVVLIGVVAFGAPLSLCDYHSPQTSLTDLKLSANYRYFDDPAVAGIEINSGRIALDYSQLFDSPDYGYSLAGIGALNVESLAPAGAVGQGSGTFRYYLNDDAPIFGFGGADVSYSFGQPKPAVNVSVGGGYGRFTDVTPLAKAVKIQNDLLALKAIPSSLSDDALMAIAEEIGKKVEYATIKDLVAAIEPIIEGEAGVTLDARALLTVEDDILATSDNASCGWVVQAGIGYELIDPYGGARDILVTVSGDASLAPLPGTQLTVHAGFFGPFDITAENTLRVNTTCDYALKEDVDLIVNYQLQRVQPRGAASDMSQSATASVAFNVGGAAVSLQVGFSKGVGATDWSKDLTISAGMDLI